MSTAETQPLAVPADASASHTVDADFSVNGMDCASCVAHVERAMRKVPGVSSAQVSLARGRAVLQLYADFGAARTRCG